MWRVFSTVLLALFAIFIAMLTLVGSAYIPTTHDSILSIPGAGKAFSMIFTHQVWRVFSTVLLALLAIFIAM
jgi:hypothetical protein